jgi:hypothetical protein
MNKFCAVAPSICASSVWKLILATFMAPRILRWLVNFWKTCAPLGKGKDLPVHVIKAYRCTPLILNPSVTSSNNSTATILANRPSHPNPLVQQIRNYIQDDLNSLYKTFKHKRRNTSCCNQRTIRCSVF